MNRQQRLKAALEQSGGRRVSLNIDGPTAKAIDREMKKTGQTQTDVVLWCVRWVLGGAKK